MENDPVEGGTPTILIVLSRFDGNPMPDPESETKAESERELDRCVLLTETRLAAKMPQLQFGILV